MCFSCFLSGEVDLVEGWRRSEKSEEFSGGCIRRVQCVQRVQRIAMEGVFAVFAMFTCTEK